MGSDGQAERKIDFGAVVDALPGLVLITQSDGRGDFVNLGWRDYTGLDLERSLDQGWQAAIHPDDLAGFHEAWDQLKQSGTAKEVEARLRRTDGEYRWFVFRASPLPQDEGDERRWCWLGSHADESAVTDGRVRRLWDMLPIRSGFLDATGVLEYSNRQSRERTLGSTVEELRDWTTSRVMLVNDYAANRARVKALLTTGEWFDEEVRMRHADGVYRWARAHAVPIRDAQGNAVRYISFQIDIDDLKRAEALLAAEVELLERVARGEPQSAVLDALCRHVEALSPGSVCSILPAANAMLDGKTISGGWSMAIPSVSGEESGVVAIHRDDAVGLTARDRDLIDRFAKIAGIVIDRTRADAALLTSERELREALAQLNEGQRLSKTGSFTSDIQQDRHRWSDEFHRIFEIDPGIPPHIEAVRARIHPDDLDRFDREMQRRIAGNGSDFDFRIETPSSGLKYLRGVAQVFEHIAGRPVFMGAIQDITESKLAEETLTRARSELAHVARIATLNTMTASIAHEVSQPLSGILINADLCVQMLAADPPNLTGAAETARRTIRDAKRASEVIQRLRAMFSKSTSTTELVEFNDLARDVITLSKNELQRNRVLLRSDFADGLPRVSADRVQLQQVVLNLLLNAADAMAGVEDRPRTILVRTNLQDNGFVRLDVRDSGMGVDPAATERLFDAFYTTKKHGLGVGLSISRSIIEQHDGRLWAKANDGPGATFSFCLPTASA